MNTNDTECGRGSPKTAGELLDMQFLHMRSALLETAATFDRIQRAPGATEVLDDPRMAKLRDSCRLLAEARGERAERFLLLFSQDAAEEPERETLK